MGRPDDAGAVGPRDRRHRERAGAPAGDVPARIHASLARPHARHVADLEPAGPPAGNGDH